MKEIYHNLKIYVLILLVSGICIDLGIIEDFYWMFLALVFFFTYFPKWKLKKMTNTEEGKQFVIMSVALGLLFIFLIKKETIFNIPKEFIAFLMAELVIIIVKRIVEYINRGKVNRV